MSFRPQTSSVKLRQVENPEHVEWVSITELTDCIEHAGPVDNIQLRPDDREWPEAIRSMADHVREVIDGTPQPGRERNDSYSPARTEASKVKAKVDELNTANVKISESTLRRRIKAFRTGGTAGVAAEMTRKSTRRDGMPQIDPRVQDVIIQVVSSATNKTTRSKKALIADIKRELLRQHPGNPELGEPSRRTFERWLDPYTHGKHTFGNARVRQTAANSPQREYRRGDLLRPGQRVEIDATPLDVMVRNEDGSASRPELTAMIDVATRAIIAWGFTTAASGGFDNALLVARAAVPPALRPGHESLSLRLSATLPHEAMVAADPRRSESYDVPFIFPEEITVDGGSSFRGSVFEDTCRRFGITLNYAAPRTPTQKPHIERVFRTIREGFSQYLTGYTGADVAHRGRDVEALWDLPGIDWMFQHWYCTVYLARPHVGLRHPLHPDLVWTPRQMYSALVEVSDGIPIPFSRSDYIACMPWQDRMITREGIRLGNRIYDSRELDGLRDRRGPRPGGKWQVHQDPNESTVVWVLHPDNQCWAAAQDKLLPYLATTPFLTETSSRLLQESTPVAATDVEAAETAFTDLVTDRERSLRKEQTRRARHNSHPDLAGHATTEPAAPEVVEFEAELTPVDGYGPVTY